MHLRTKSSPPPKTRLMISAGGWRANLGAMISGDSSSLPDVALIVVNYQSAELAVAAVASARAASSDPLEVLIVDNSCDPEEARRLANASADQLIVAAFGFVPQGPCRIAISGVTPVTQRQHIVAAVFPADQITVDVSPDCWHGFLLQKVAPQDSIPSTVYRYHTQCGKALPLGCYR